MNKYWEEKKIEWIITNLLWVLFSGEPWLIHLVPGLLLGSPAWDSWPAVTLERHLYFRAKHCEAFLQGILSILKQLGSRRRNTIKARWLFPSWHCLFPPVEGWALASCCPAAVSFSITWKEELLSHQARVRLKKIRLCMWKDFGNDEAGAALFYNWASPWLRRTAFFGVELRLTQSYCLSSALGQVTRPLWDSSPPRPGGETEAQRGKGACPRSHSRAD